MKHSHGKHLLKRPVSQATKKMRSWYTKSPILTLVGVLFLIVALSGTSYGAYGYLQSRDDKRAAVTANQTEASLQDDIADIDDIELTEKAKTDSLKKASETKKDYSDPRAPTLSTGAGCVGVRCLKLGGFVITASPKTITVTAGETFGPIKLKTADGRKANWGGMPEDGYVSDGDYVGVSTHGQTFPGNSTSFDYYLNATARAKGTYKLTFHATRKDEGVWAQTTVTVKVIPGPYYKISVGTASLGSSNLAIPITIHRYSGHTGGWSASGKVTCPGNSTKTFGEWSSANQIIASVSVTPFTLPNKCKVQLEIWDEYGQYKNDPFTFSVQ